jgi:hypothetical protein
LRSGRIGTGRDGSNGGSGNRENNLSALKPSPTSTQNKNIKHGINELPIFQAVCFLQILDEDDTKHTYNQDYPTGKGLGMDSRGRRFTLNRIQRTEALRYSDDWTDEVHIENYSRCQTRK